MTYPTKPADIYDYSAYQESEPTLPLPAPQVAADLDHLKHAIDAIIAFQKLQSTSSGKAAPASVSPSAFDAAARALLSAGGDISVRGTWTTATAYAADDIVGQGGGTYIAAIAHTSGTFTTDLAAAKWLILSAPPPATPSLTAFGVSGDGADPDSTPIQTAIDSIQEGEVGSIIAPRPSESYYLDTDVEFNGRFVSFEMEPGTTFSGPGKINGPYNRTVRRIPNRVFIGMATDANDGREFWLTTEKDWVETEVAGTTSTDSLVVISDIGFGAIMGASRTSDNTLEQSEGTRSIGAITIADQPGDFSAYGLYSEIRRKGNAGWAHVAELDLISRLGSVSGFEAITTPLLTPNSPYTAHALTGPWVSIGRPDVDDCGDASVGLMFVNNAGARTGEAGRLKIGIVFDQRSILGEGGAYAGNTFGQAIAMGRRHQLAWYNAASGAAPASWISMSADIVDAPCIEFVNAGTIFRSEGGSWSAVIEQFDDQDGALHLVPGSAAAPAFLYVGAPDGGSGTRDLNIAAFTGTVRLQGTKDVTAFSAYSVAGHANAVHVLANAAGFSPVVEVAGPDTNIHLTLRGKGAGTVILQNLPTSASGLTSGCLWNDAGTVKVV